MGALLLLSAVLAVAAQAAWLAHVDASATPLTGGLSSNGE